MATYVFTWVQAQAKLVTLNPENSVMGQAGHMAQELAYFLVASCQKKAERMPCPKLARLWVFSFINSLDIDCVSAWV